MEQTLHVGSSDFTIEYKLAPNMVVFSHGLGVQRDARGLFTDLSAKLPAGFGYVMFDYNNVDKEKKTVKVTMFKEHVQRLQVVIEWINQQKDVTAYHIVAHSMGCTVVAELAPGNVGGLIMLAPPLSFSNSLMDHLTHKEGAVKDERAIWHVPRSDGTTSLIGGEIFQQWARIDYEGELVKLALLHPFSLIIPESDEVIPDTDYTELIVMSPITSIGIDGADHNFSGRAREELAAAINTQLSATLRP